MGVWKDAFATKKLKDQRVSEEGNRIKVTYDYELLQGKAHLSVNYLIGENGAMDVAIKLDKDADLPPLPRMGMQMQIPESWDQVRYYGKGPHETYWDRNQGAKIGVYQQDLSSFGTDYVRPQEHGNHSDIRWIRFSQTSGKGIQFSGKGLNVSAWPYDQEDLEKASHDYMLPNRDFIHLEIGGYQMGVGGDDTWSPRSAPHPEHMLTKETYEFSFNMKPVTQT
jgi:beta-galactosidase